MQLSLLVVAVVLRVIFGFFLGYRINKIHGSIQERFQDHPSIVKQQDVFRRLIFFARVILGLLLCVLVVILY